MAWSSRFWFTSQTRTAVLWAPTSFAVASPIPPAPPVMTHTVLTPSSSALRSDTVGLDDRGELGGCSPVHDHAVTAELELVPDGGDAVGRRSGGCRCQP